MGWWELFCCHKMSAYARASARRTSKSSSSGKGGGRSKSRASFSGSKRQQGGKPRASRGEEDILRRKESGSENEDEFTGIGLSQVPLSQVSDVVYPTLSQVLGEGGSGSNSNTVGGGEGRYNTARVVGGKGGREVSMLSSSSSSAAMPISRWMLPKQQEQQQQQQRSSPFEPGELN